MSAVDDLPVAHDSDRNRDRGIGIRGTYRPFTGTPGSRCRRRTDRPAAT